MFFNNLFFCRHCWPVVTPKEDAEFRKAACAWLREIMVSMRIYSYQLPTMHLGNYVLIIFLSSFCPAVCLLLSSHIVCTQSKKNSTVKPYDCQINYMRSVKLNLYHLFLLCVFRMKLQMQDPRWQHPYSSHLEATNLSA